MDDHIEALTSDDLDALCEAFAFADWIARIRQRPDGHFEHRRMIYDYVPHPDGSFTQGEPRGEEWLTYLPGGYPYGHREVEALRARGDSITDENVSCACCPSPSD